MEALRRRIKGASFIQNSGKQPLLFYLFAAKIALAERKRYIPETSLPWKAIAPKTDRTWRTPGEITLAGGKQVFAGSTGEPGAGSESNKVAPYQNRSFKAN